MNKLSKILLVIIILLVIALGIAIYSSYRNLNKVLQSNEELTKVVEAVNDAGYDIEIKEDNTRVLVQRVE